MYSLTPVSMMFSTVTPTELIIVHHLACLEGFAHVGDHGDKRVEQREPCVGVLEGVFMRGGEHA